MIEELSSLGLKVVDTTRYIEDMGQFKGKPLAVIMAGSTEDVVKIVKFALKYKIPIIPWGAGTSVTGAAVGDGIIVDVSQIKFIHIDDINWTVHVGVGVTIEELNKELSKKGFFFPPDPASSFMCTIGGAIATGAGGMRCVKYGTMKDWVLALKLVTPTGEVIKIGEPLTKNRAGYDLVRLLVGSEGTLGIITEAWLKIIPLPEYKIFRALIIFNKIEDIGKLIIQIRKAGIYPEIAEFMDYKILNALKDVFNIEVDGEGALLIDIPEFQLNKFINIINNFNIKIQIAENEIQREELYKARAYAYLALKAKAKYLMTEDIVVPIHKIPEALKKIRELENKYGIEAPTVGHIGDGNLHPIIIFDDTTATSARKFFNELCEFAINIGGSVSGEHGIGVQKIIHFRKQVEEHNGAKVLEIMKAIKRMFDPYRIMNPHKYVDYDEQNI
jgi:glycolate oxidase